MEEALKKRQQLSADMKGLLKKGQQFFHHADGSVVLLQEVDYLVPQLVHGAPELARQGYCIRDEENRHCDVLNVKLRPPGELARPTPSYFGVCAAGNMLYAWGGGELQTFSLDASPGSSRELLVLDLAAVKGALDEQ